MADYATLLRDHITLEFPSIDRIFLQAYVPKLQSVGQVCTFLRWGRQFPIPSSAAFGKIGRAYEAEIRRFAESNPPTGVSATPNQQTYYPPQTWPPSRR